MKLKPEFVITMDKSLIHNFEEEARPELKVNLVKPIVYDLSVKFLKVAH